MRPHRRVNNNNNNNNEEGPENLVSMPMHLWTDPSFWDDEESQNFVLINGKRVPNVTTLNELGLSLTQNNVYSDPGNYNLNNNTMSPLALPPTAVASKPDNKIIRSLAMPKQRKTVKKAKAKATKSNNRFGFKKAFGSLQSGFKKLTGRSRKNRRN